MTVGANAVEGGHIAGSQEVAPLKVLVVGTDDWSTDQVARVVAASGHRVLGCHPSGDPAFPCNALVKGRQCPLDVGFDVIVAVRARPAGEITPGEMGVICALRRGVPLVVAGMGGAAPFEPWATRVLKQGDEVVTACEEAVRLHPQRIELRHRPERTSTART